MDKQFQIVTLLLLLLFVSGVVVNVEGRKNCDHGSQSKCFPKEKCDPRICAILCSRSEEYECDDYGCVCWWGCRNSTTTHHHPQPPPKPLLSSYMQHLICM
ncbi:hypothetical protein ABFS83_11G019900 [Erythranthe nasuta]